MTSISEKGQKLHRLTFSKTLAELSQAQAEQFWGLKTELNRFEFQVGRRLKEGELSQSGAYAIVSEESNIPLRVSLIKDLAWLQKDNSRYIAECWLIN